MLASKLAQLAKNELVLVKLVPHCRAYSRNSPRRELKMVQHGGAAESIPTRTKGTKGTRMSGNNLHDELTSGREMHGEVKVYWQFLAMCVFCRVTRRVPVPVPRLSRTQG
jgi:hypothetical protein